MEEKTLRPRQTAAINGLAQSLIGGNKRPMLQLPTGGGKTLVACRIVKRAAAKGNTTMFVVPAISLIEQTVAAFIDDGIPREDISVIHTDDPRMNMDLPVQVCSLQTLANRKRLPDADLVIVDEAHRWFKSMGNMMERWDRVPFIGLSATPWTKGLGQHYDDLIVGGTTQDMIDEGHLSPFEVYCAPRSPDLSKVKLVAGDYHEGQLSTVMQDSGLVADIIDTWRKYGNDAPTLCYGVDRAHANKMREQFVSNGIPTGYMDAFTPLDERKEIERQFHCGDIKIVCNVGVLTTGIDWDVRTLILARPCRSEILFTQIIGRALRLGPGKTIATILDHSSTHETLGLVTDIHHDSLCDGKGNEAGKKAPEEKEAKLPKKCPACQFLKPAGVHECPKCGFAPSKRSEIEVQAGELVKLEAAKQSEASVKARRNRSDTKEQKNIMHQSFQLIAKRHAYSDGWVAHSYKKYYGVWPRGRERVPGLFVPCDKASLAVDQAQREYRARQKNNG